VTTAGGRGEGGEVMGKRYSDRKHCATRMFSDEG
jgi:hypothetical protein